MSQTAPATADKTAPAAKSVELAADKGKKDAKPSEEKLKLRDDLGKSVRDFFNKQFVAPGNFKFESKAKGPADRLYVNPKFELGSKSSFTVDVQYDNTQQFPVNSTLTIDVGKGAAATAPAAAATAPAAAAPAAAAPATAADPAKKGDSKATPLWKLLTKAPVPAIKGNVEVEATDKTLAVTVDGSVGPVKFVDKVDANAFETVLTYTKDVATVGAFGRFKFNPSAFDFGLAARYARKGQTLTAFVANTGVLSIAASLPFTVGSYAFSAYALLEAEKFVAPTPKSVVGLEARVCSALSVRAKLSLAQEFALCLINKLPNNLTVALTLSQAKSSKCPYGFNAGIQLTQE